MNIDHAQRHTHGNMHITHIASGDLWAGAEVQLYTLCKTLNNMPEIKVSVILLNHGTLADKLLAQNICVEILDETKLSSARIFTGLIKTLKQLKPNVVHTHRNKENILGSITAKIAGNMPSLRTVHGAPEHRPSIKKPQQYLLYWLDWLTARYLQAKIIAVSEDLKTQLTKSYPENKIEVIENGVDIEALACHVKKQVPDMPGNKKSYKVGLVGRLVPVKRVDVFIKTAEYIKTHHPELSIQFHIYGDGPLLNELKQLCNELAVNDIVQFEGHCDDIHAQIASLDALLITSDHEGLPMTLLEAMALGTPVIAHSVGGITNVCQKGTSCWLVKQNTPELLSQKLNDCLSNKEQRRIITNMAIQQINQKYSSKNNAKSYTALYSNTIKGKQND